MEGLIGLFAKRAILRADLSERATFRDVLGRVRDTATGAYVHLDVSQELVFPERGFDHPLHWSNVPVHFNFIESSPHQLTFPGLSVSPVDRPGNDIRSLTILNFIVQEREHDLVLRIGSRYGLYSPARARQHLDSFYALLQRLVEAPNRRLPGAPLLQHS
jgi:non-ribosomal peptide synthetase component F